MHSRSPLGRRIAYFAFGMMLIGSWTTQSRLADYTWDPTIFVE